MENDKVAVEYIVGNAIGNVYMYLAGRGVDSVWWKFVVIIAYPFLVFAYALLGIPIGIRLAISNADRVIFVLASSLLSFYQIPRTVFYIYISVLGFTGFLQFLKYDSHIRCKILWFFVDLTRGKSNMFLRKYTSLHFSNPFSRCPSYSEVVYMAVGSPLPAAQGAQVHHFPISITLDFVKDIGDCKLKIKTLQNNIRYLRVIAPWGRNAVSFYMENDNLGKFISYLDNLNLVQDKGETDNSTLICKNAGVTDSLQFNALTLLETIDYFNSGIELVKLQSSGMRSYVII